jgi:hypothetical protein
MWGGDHVFTKSFKHIWVYQIVHGQDLTLKWMNERPHHIKPLNDQIHKQLQLL